MNRQEQAKAEVEEALRDWNVVNRMPGKAGRDGYASFLSDDAVWLPAHAPFEEGRDAIMQNPMQDVMGNKDVSFEILATRVEAASSGDMAVGMGTWSARFTEPDGNEVCEVGKFMDVWRKQPDGSWKCIAGMDNSDRPIASTP